jgi:hypothetical protein
VAAPDYVPVLPQDQVRRGERLPPARPWYPRRPGDLPHNQPTGPKLGTPGPDPGYALVLARHFEERLRLVDGESAEDAAVGCVAVALRRCSLLGRAPCIYDLELAFGVWGFLDDAPPELVAFRKRLFEGARHQYWDQREIVDRVTEEALRSTPAHVRERLALSWQHNLVVD